MRGAGTVRVAVLGLLWGSAFLWTKLALQGLTPAQVVAARLTLAAAVLVPIGVLLGMPLPGGMRLLARHQPDMVAWGWGLNGAFSVIGATLAVFIAMNWGFSITLLVSAVVYGGAAAVLQTR